MRNPEFYRHMISKRAAVKALEEINKALNKVVNPEFWSYESGKAGEYDASVYSMAREISRLVQEV